MTVMQAFREQETGDREQGNNTQRPASLTPQSKIVSSSLLLLSSSSLLVAGCGQIQEQTQKLTGSVKPEFAPLPSDRAKVAAAVEVLGRAAFGHRPGDIQRVVEIGTGAWLEEQLGSVRYEAIEPQRGFFSRYQQQVFGAPERWDAVETFSDNPAVAWRVNALDSQSYQDSAPEMLYNLPDEQLTRESQQAVILRGVYSRFQLRETLSDFWTNHLNIYALKEDGRVLIPVDTERIIRKFALFKFREMLWHSAHSPAMLQYLDNQQNRKGVANENYARELLELHTVGVDAGYTLRDIQEVARCFTGWGVKQGIQRGQFVYNPNEHDQGEKFIPFLNLRIAPKGGQKDAEIILEQLVVHPATARFLSRKLCRRYLGHAPADIVEKAAKAYLKSDTDIKAMLRPILLDGLARDNNTQPVLKRPVDFVVSALRAIGADTNAGQAVTEHMEAMGQTLYQWPMPDGFPEKAAAWTGTLMQRWNFALALASQSLGETSVDLLSLVKAFGAKTDAAEREALTTALLPCGATPELNAALDAHAAKARKSGLPDHAVRAEIAALILASPAFQWKGVTSHHG
jgi:uncharacterized protein (DUF1800 family)